MKRNLYQLLKDTSVVLNYRTKLLMSQRVIVTIAYLHQVYQDLRFDPDLKSMNVLCGEYTEDLVLCDFGLTRIVNRTELMTSNVGTLAWIAPEVIKKEKYTETDDIVILRYHLFLCMTI